MVYIQADRKLRDSSRNSEGQPEGCHLDGRSNRVDLDRLTPEPGNSDAIVHRHLVAA
jgi:hypothetical protein